MLDVTTGPVTQTKEKLVLYGGWKDYTGSGGIGGKEQEMQGGVSDELWGQNAWLLGGRKQQLGVIGEPIQTIRLRPKKILIDPEIMEKSVA